MASSSENLVNFEPWMFRSTFADSWISEAFARDTETLTKALQQSLSNNNNNNNSQTTLTSDSTTTMMSPFIINTVVSSAAAAVSSVSGSDDPETAPNRRRIVPMNGVGGGKIAKRKSRASKRCTTTFITADPANFRQMVQQVTGVRFGTSNVPAAVGGILKPEPQRPGNRLQGCLPTLDTSAFLLDRYQQPEVSPGTSSEVGGEGHVSFNSAPVMLGDGGGAGLGFDSFSNFPTLESWKVM